MSDFAPIEPVCFLSDLPPVKPSAGIREIRRTGEHAGCAEPGVA